MTAVERGVIIKGVGGAYTVSNGERSQYICVARGVFRKMGVTPLVGDRVEFSVEDAAARTGMLLKILPRQNELTRPRAANIDRVIVTVSAAQPAFNGGLLDRYLLLAEYAGIPSITVCVNKNDLVSSAESLEMIAPYAQAGYEALTVSAHTGDGTEKLRALMKGQLSLFAGPSGVGKSSLINRLSGSEAASRETGELSKKIDRGKHTTRHTEILPLKPSGYFVDTPGFTRLDIDGIPPEKYAALFREFRPFLGKCRFSNCRHLSESDCAVREQVGRAIHPLRYESYKQLASN
jgi:ribosome biogenesis GTPase